MSTNIAHARNTAEATHASSSLVLRHCRDDSGHFCLVVAMHGDGRGGRQLEAVLHHHLEHQAERRRESDHAELLHAEHARQVRQEQQSDQIVRKRESV